jgi:peroxiredoxin
LIQSIFIFGDEPIQFSQTLTSISGEGIDVEKLSESKTIVVVTLKSHTCSVCKNQLERIKRNLDAFEMCNLSFLVVCPGTIDEVKSVKRESDFPFPFIADTNLEIGNQMGLTLGDSELYPSIFVLNKDRTIRWMQKGRNYLYYGDDELKEALNCHNWI